MPAGRPTSYKSEYCEAVIGFGELGKSLAWIAAKLDVSRECIYEWSRVHPELSDAMARARLKSQAWWEDFGQENTMLAPGAGTFNAAAWGKSVSARFPDDWREKVAIGGADDMPPIKTVTDDQLLARIAALQAKVSGDKV